MIITIYDIDYNGKTGKKKYDFIKKQYRKCILNFKGNKRIKFDEIKIKNDNLINIINNDVINLDKIKIIIFNYGEDNPLSKLYINSCIDIYNFIKRKYNKIKIFNDPHNHNIISDNYITYSKLKNNKLINIPDFNLIKDINDVKQINKFPIIVSKRQQTGGKEKFKINCVNEFDNIEYKNKYWCKFYDSFLPNTKYRIGIRLFIYNNILIDYSCRPSLEWNIHNGNQIKDVTILKKADDFFKDYIKNNNDLQSMLDELYKILGNGLYGHDFILHNNKLILCELGYKTLDQSLMKFHKENNLLNILPHKICNDFEKVHKTYKNLILNE